MRKANKLANQETHSFDCRAHRSKVCLRQSGRGSRQRFAGVGMAVAAGLL
jgi:hypothetical protein